MNPRHTSAMPIDAMTDTSALRTSPAEQVRAANTDNGRLIFGAALAVHALMLVVALATALAFSLIVRRLPAPESNP